MNNNYGLLLNEIISKILSLDVNKDEIKIYIQNNNDSNLLLKLNNDLLNNSSCTKVTFYYDETNKNIDELINFSKNHNIHIGVNNSDFDFIIANFAFNDIDNKILKSRELIKDNFSKLLLLLSSEFFDENKAILNNLNNINNLNSIISLPITENNENLIMIYINSQKESKDVILIDESDSLIHEKTNDWSFISEEITKNIINSFKNFSEYENSIILPVSSIIKKESIFGSELSKYIEEDYNHIYSKKRVLANKVADNILKDKNVTNIDYIGKMSNFSLKEYFYGKKIQDLKNLNIKNNKKIIDEDIKIKKLVDLVNMRNIHKKNQKDTLLIATCKDCTSKIVFNNFDVEDFNDEIYIEVNVISKEIMKEYLLAYLNSANGLNEIFYFSKGNMYITPEKIKDVRIPIPSKKVQKEIVKAVQETNKFFKEIDLLRKDFESNILDYKSILESIGEFKGNIEVDDDLGIVINMSRNWQHVYNGLIWPLAISYLQVTSGKNKGVTKLRNYLRLFEFVVAFNFIILLSGLPDNVYDEFKFEIWNAPSLKLYKNMTFGRWIRLTENISKIYKNNNFVSNLDKNLLEKISNNKILDIYNRTLECRNSVDSHGSMLVDEEAEEILEELDKYLEDIFDILDVYAKYKLIYITGELTRNNNKFNHEVILLNGPYAQPVYEHFIFNEILQENSLYLFNPKNNKKILIKDNLMKFCPIDKYKKHWALFLYSQCDKDEKIASYKCFQSNENDVEVEINSLKNNIIN